MQDRRFWTTQIAAKLLIAAFLIIFILDLFFNGNLYSYGALQKNTGEYRRFVTAAFLHSNILHLAANCLAIWYVAEILETKLSAVWFIVIFPVANIVTYIAFSKVWIFDTSVGSSPGIYALFAVCLMMCFKDRELFRDIRHTYAFHFMIGYAIIPQFFGVSTCFVHGIGALIGLALALIYNNKNKRNAAI